MAFFKFRKSGDEQSSTPAPPESIEVMRRRAKHRLIGAAVLVLLGVVGFPLLFDKQPRPISVDMPIEIPDRNKVKPLGIPVPVPVPAPASAPASAPQAEPVLKEAPAAAAQAAPKMIAEPELKPVAKTDEAAKIQALLEAKEPEKKASASDGRFVVQVGAFADVARAREVRQKVEHAGLKTYTQVAETKDGRRIRVRVGPFADKAEADRAAEKIRKLDLPAAILTL